MAPPTHGPGVVNGHTRNSPYEYTPSAPANITFLVVFAYSQVIRLLILRVLTFGHAFLSIKYRSWFFSSMFVLGGIGIIQSAKYSQLGEVIGYAGRVGSAYDVTLNNYFLIQIVCLVIAPAFFSAGLYLTIGNLFHSQLNWLTIGLLSLDEQTRI